MEIHRTGCSLLNLIEEKRKELLVVASKTGLSSLDTVKVSSELDHLLNLHQQAPFNQKICKI